MNYPNIIEEITHAELEGFHRGLKQGRSEALACSIRDRETDWNRGHARGLVVGSLIGGFLLSAFCLGIFLVFFK